MLSLSMNIKLNYLYRDGANYKQYHYEVYTNLQGLSLEEIERRLREQLIDGEWFYNHNWDLKDLHYHAWDNEIDHTWHEFDCIVLTYEPAAKGDINELLLRVAMVDKYFCGVRV